MNNMDNTVKELDIWVGKLENYLNKEEVSSLKTNIEVISLYDLFKIVDNEFKDLRNVTIQLDEKLNSSLNIFSGVKNPRTLVDFDKIYSNTCIYFYDDSSTYVKLKIIKRIKEKDFCHTRTKTKNNKFYYNFVEKNHDLILKMFEDIEQYFDLMFYPPLPRKYFGDDWFWVDLHFSNSGNIKIDIYFNYHQEYYREFEKRFSFIFIDDFCKQHKEEILKRIPVNPSKLPEPFKTLYNRHKEKENNKIKVKSLYTK